MTRVKSPIAITHSNQVTWLVSECFCVQTVQDIVFRLQVHGIRLKWSRRMQLPGRIHLHVHVIFINCTKKWNKIIQNVLTLYLMTVPAIFTQSNLSDCTFVHQTIVKIGMFHIIDMEISLKLVKSCINQVKSMKSQLFSKSRCFSTFSLESCKLAL
jgi:hypothetical protein